jgi:uncharacterized protein YacL
MMMIIHHPSECFLTMKLKRNPNKNPNKQSNTKRRKTSLIMEKQQFYYDNKIVRNFLYATIAFGVIGMLVGLLVAFLYLFPNLTERNSVVKFWTIKTFTHQCGYFCFRW